MAQEFGVEFLGILVIYWISINNIYFPFLILLFSDLGRVPIDPSLTLMVEKSDDDNTTLENGLVKKYIGPNLYKVFNRIADKIVAKVT